jgi:hypothetical protein
VLQENPKAAARGRVAVEALRQISAHRRQPGILPLAHDLE